MSQLMRRPGAGLKGHAAPAVDIVAKLNLKCARYLDMFVSGDLRMLCCMRSFKMFPFIEREKERLSNFLDPVI